MELKTILEHILLTLVPWLVGMVIGGGLGVVVALIARFLFSTVPALRWLSMVVPWRTVLTGLLVVVWSPMIVVWLGIGPLAGGVMVGLVVLLLATAFTGYVLVEHWHPTPVMVQLIALARNLGVLCSMIVVGAGFFGGGGVGAVMMQGMMLLRRELFWQGVLVVVGTALLLDLGLGLLQLTVARLVERQRQAQSVP
jgi:ABC-type nitrate/sulfonate/bicarbonate transport system permease component